MSLRYALNTMAYIPLHWSYQDDQGDVKVASGARLLDMFAVEVVDPRLSKVPAVLHSAPGFRAWSPAARLSLPTSVRVQDLLNVPDGRIPATTIVGLHATPTTLWVLDAGPTTQVFAVAGSGAARPGVRLPSQDFQTPHTGALDIAGSADTLFILAADESGRGVIRPYTLAGISGTSRLLPVLSTEPVAIWVQDDTLWVLDDRDVSGQRRLWHAPLTAVRGAAATIGAFEGPEFFDAQPSQHFTAAAFDATASRALLLDATARSILIHSRAGRPEGAGLQPDDARGIDFASLSARFRIQWAEGFCTDGDTAWLVDSAANRSVLATTPNPAIAGRGDARLISGRDLVPPRRGNLRELSVAAGVVSALILQTRTIGAHLSSYTNRVLHYDAQTGKLLSGGSAETILPRAIAFPSGLSVDAGGMWIGDGTNPRVIHRLVRGYGDRDASRDFTLPREYSAPAGISAHGALYHILDSTTRALVVPVLAGDRSFRTHISLGAALSDARGLEEDSDAFYVLRGTRVEGFNRQGRSELGGFGLAPDTTDPRDLILTDNRAYVLDATARALHAYDRHSGQFGLRNAGLDVLSDTLVRGMEQPQGITGIRHLGRTRIWVLEGGRTGTGWFELEQAADGTLSRRTVGAQDMRLRSGFGDDIWDLQVTRPPSGYPVGNHSLLMLFGSDERPRGVEYAWLDGTTRRWRLGGVLIATGDDCRGVATDGTWIYFLMPPRQKTIWRAPLTLVNTRQGRPGDGAFRANDVRDPGWEIRLPDSFAQATGLFYTQGLLYVTDPRNSVATPWDVTGNRPVRAASTFSILLAEEKAESFWSDGRYAYAAHNWDDLSKSRITGYWMSSARRNATLDIKLHTNQTQPAGAALSGTVIFVGSRGSQRQGFLYDIDTRTALDARVPLDPNNTQTVAGVGVSGGAYLLDKDGTAYWYGLTGTQFVLDPSRQITCAQSQAAIGGLWARSAEQLFVSDPVHGDCHVYNTVTRREVRADYFKFTDEHKREGVTDVWGDAEGVYVASRTGRVRYYTTGTLSMPEICALPTRVHEPSAVAADGRYYWVAGQTSNEIVAIDAKQCIEALGPHITKNISNSILALLAIDSPRVGQHLVGVTQGHLFHYVQEGGTWTLEAFPETVNEIITSSSVQIAADPQYVYLPTPTTIKVYSLSLRRFIEPEIPQAASFAAEVFDEEWVSVVWLDGYVVLATRGGEIFASELHTSPPVFRQSNFIRSETYPDHLVRLEIWNHQLFIFKSRSIELWYVTGDQFPFRRNRVLAYNIGAAAPGAIAVDVGGIVFLGSDGIVYLCTGTLQAVSTPPVEEQIAVSDLSRASAVTYTERGQRFFLLTLSTGTVLGLHLNTGLWHERSTADVQALAPFAGTTLVARGSTVQEMTVAADTDAADPDNVKLLKRELISPAIDANRRRMRIFSFQVEIPHRSGGNADDKVLLDWSTDGQQNWRPATPLELTMPVSSSAAPRRYKWNRCGGSRARHFRLKIQAARSVEVLGAYILSDVDAT